MKKNLHYALHRLTFIALLFITMHAGATVWVVSVSDFQFSPQSIPNVMVGDTIRWQWVNGNHTTTSNSTPVVPLRGTILLPIPASCSSIT